MNGYIQNSTMGNDKLLSNGIEMKDNFNLIGVILTEKVKQ